MFLMANPSGASEMDDRREIGSVVQDAFAQDRFAKISALAERYRVEKARTESGLWKLTLVYAAISHAISNEAAQDDIGKGFLVVEKKIQRWIKLQPRSPTAHLAYATLFTDHAWAISNLDDGPMTPAARASFNLLFEKARRYLEKTRPIAAVDPYWYESMLDIGRVQSWDAAKFDAMFDAAVEREPLFYQTWFVAAHYLMEQSPPDMANLELLAQRGATMTAATEGKAMYARIYWSTLQHGIGNDLFRTSQADWPRMKASFDDMLAQYPDAWNDNTYGKFACLAMDKKSARAFFTKIGDQPLMAAWPSRGFMDGCRTWAMAGAI